jgi:glycosyltransferase involved in cell wall biosynthesis
MFNSANVGCCYVRILLPAFANGYLTDRTSVRAKRCRDEKMLSTFLNSADVVVFHRPENEQYLNLIKQLKDNGKKIVIDNDDTFKISDNHPLATWTCDAMKVELENRDRYFDTIAKEADLMTTTNNVLKEEYKKINDNVVVLPNCVDPMDWEEPLRNDGKKVRIGVVGSVSYSYDYSHIREELKELSNRPDVQLVMFGLGDKEHRKKNPEVTKHFENEYLFWDSLNIEQIPWCHIADYPSYLNNARLDFMLIPRRDNYFNRCKSNIKFLEAGMCEIPVIAQSYNGAPYEEIVHGDTGLLVKDNKDWMKQIESLIDYPDRRRFMGVKAKDYILENYNIENKAHLWDEAYKKIWT